MPRRKDAIRSCTELVDTGDLEVDVAQHLPYLYRGKDWAPLALDVRQAPRALRNLGYDAIRAVRAGPQARPADDCRFDLAFGPRSVWDLSIPASVGGSAGTTVVALDLPGCVDFMDSETMMFD